MTNEEILEAAKRDMDVAVTADEQNRKDGNDDLRFVTGKGQWPEAERLQREKDQRPVITINRLAQFVRQVTGDIRRTNPAVKVKPSDDEASEEGAELLEGIVRGVEYRSSASAIYEGATESAAQCGIGNFRILTEYEADDSFNQHILVKRIHNPFAVYWDPEARDPTRSDARFCFVTDQMDEEDFKKAYPDESASDVQQDGVADKMEYWRDGASVVLAEYFWKEPTKKTIYLMADGNVTEDNAFKSQAVKKRTVDTHKVMWVKVSGLSVLEGPTEIPSKYIPVISVVGEEIYVGGEVVRTSVIRFAKDPQVLYNYWSSAQAELIALQPKTPYMVTPKQIAGLETFWNQANVANRPYLPYNPDEKAQKPAREAPPIASQAIMGEIAKAVDDMKATTGIYDAGLGNKSNEQSGVAIRQRQMESDISTSIYSDNMAKAIEHCGRVLVDMIPRVYDTARTVQIIDGEGQEQSTQVNGPPVFDQRQGAFVPVNPLGKGRYDVRVSVGPNYSTRRQETQEGMMQFIQAFPAAAPVVGDLFAKAMEWPDADKIADRLKKMLPPGVAEQEQPTPEQAQQMQQQQAMQAEAMAMQKAKAVADVQTEQSKAEKAKADAAKAKAEAIEAEASAMIKVAEARAMGLMMPPPPQMRPVQMMPQPMPQGQRPF